MGAATFQAAKKPVVAAAKKKSGLPSPARMIDVTIDEIQVWRGQPRLARNARYDTLKESIRNMGGLERPIDLTTEPGVEGYVTRKGGGTRLLILHELWAETGDRRFYQHTLPLHEYPGPVAMRVSHNIENLERGEQTWGDTARSIAQLCADLNDELGDFYERTLRDRASIITARGLPLRHNRLTLYQYTVERLLEHLPKAFGAGMGRPRVEAIRKLEKQFEAHVQREAIDMLPDWKNAFVECLKTADADDVDIDALERTLSLRLKNDFDIHIVDSQLSQKHPDAGHQSGQTGAVEQGAQINGSKRQAGPSGTNSGQVPPGTNSGSGFGPTGTRDSAEMRHGAVPGGSGPSGTSDPATTDGDEEIGESGPTGTSQDEPLETPENLRDRASQLSVDLATEYGLLGGALFAVNNPPVGLGYGVSDLDAVRLHEREDWQDCLLVFSVMHACMWASVLVDVELGFLQREALAEIGDSSPEVVGAAVSWDHPRATQVAVHRQHLQCRVSAGLATDQETALIGKLQSLEGLATAYAAAMRNARDKLQAVDHG